MPRKERGIQEVAMQLEGWREAWRRKKECRKSVFRSSEVVSLESFILSNHF
jgi:hypothetical protein